MRPFTVASESYLKDVLLERLVGFCNGALAFIVADFLYDCASLCHVGRSCVSSRPLVLTIGD